MLKCKERLHLRSAAVIIPSVWFLFLSCSKKEDTPPPPPPPANFTASRWLVNGIASLTTNVDVPVAPVIELKFPKAIDRISVAAGLYLKERSGAPVNYTLTYTNADSTITLQPVSPLAHIARYTVGLSTQIKSTEGGHLSTATEINLLTSIDSSNKFPVLTDDSLLTLVQKQTFRYFWDFAHPVSGLARERNTSGDVVTTGGSGFGIMAMIAAIHRNFITRSDGSTMIKKMVDFLAHTAQKYHGAFPHWLNGSSGITVPFSANDNGADLVETSYLMEGLLCARQYFDRADTDEKYIRDNIDTLWRNVEWDWFRQNGQQVLYWHWSPDKQWIMNFPIRGWNESLVAYVLAASSPSHAIPKTVYDEGWAQNGAIVNTKNFYGYTLPVGPNLGGPLFFSHYSFLGINPNGLSDTYANYQTQTVNHSFINNAYCKANPKNFFGYSDSCWGLTASDEPGGYDAHSPTNDRGVITPTAALSSFPYTPAKSMQALHFFYYILGDKLWKEYGFVDAFALQEPWFADSFLAIDQGPIIVMVENYRSGLLWNLFTSCPEVKNGMKSLGFQAPYL